LAQSQPRRDYIDTLKGLGILLVVMGHFMEWYRVNTPLIGAVFQCIYLFHMALFCICSGLVARFNLRKLLTQQLWLYLAGQGIMYLFRLYFLGENFAETGGRLAALLLPWRHMWYLYALVFWHFTLPLLQFLRDRLKLYGAFLGMLLAVIIGLWAGRIEWPFTLVRVFAYFPFYAFGVLFRPGLDALAHTARSKRPLRVAALLSFGGFYLWIFVSHLTSEVPVVESAKIFHDVPYFDGYTMKDRLVFYLIGILSTTALIVLLANYKGSLSALGRRTLPIYLLHLPILAFLSEQGFYAVALDKPLFMLLFWIALQGLGCLCLLSTFPVQTLFSWISNFWYKKSSR